MSNENTLPVPSQLPVPEKVFSEEEKKLCLESALFYLGNQQAFYGSMLQGINIRYLTQIPTAAITFNPKDEQFEIFLNPTFFCSMDLPQRIALLHHEILHFTNKHLFRMPFLNASEEDRKMYNFAGDMAINQYIHDLPKGVVDVKDWKDEKGNAYPLYRTMEEYFLLIKDSQKQNQKLMQMYGDEGESLDQHMWEEMDEEAKKKMLEEAKKLIKRTIEKTGFGHSIVPDSIKDLLQEIETLSVGISYKQILRNTIKKTVCVQDRTSTWKKPNKRYGAYSPGTKVGNLPKCAMYVDSSGSISVKELNEFLGIISNFLNVGARQCSLALWHTSMYHKQKYKLREKLDKSVLQSGGTDVNCVMADIEKYSPDLSIILTDLYFDYPEKFPKGKEVIWIVSKGGNKNHKFPKDQKVIFLDSLKD